LLPDSDNKNLRTIRRFPYAAGSPFRWLEVTALRLYRLLRGAYSRFNNDIDLKEKFAAIAV